MTQEEKRLLLQDLSARLPYGVIVRLDYRDGTIVTREMGVGSFHDILFGNAKGKPYLRPMSSITDGEKEELTEEHKKDERIYIDVIERVANGDKHARGTAVPHFAADWCNEHHFDCRGLIERGLAIAVTEKNNPYEN